MEHWLLQDEVITIDWESSRSYPLCFLFFFLDLIFFIIGDLYKYGTRIATHLDGSYCKLWCARQVDVTFEPTEAERNWL